MANGTVHTAATDFPKGDIYRTPLTEEEIRAKFRENVSFSKHISLEKAEKVREMVESLEQVQDVRDITALLV